VYKSPRAGNGANAPDSEAFAIAKSGSWGAGSMFRVQKVFRAGRFRLAGTDCPGRVFKKGQGIF
jgi:hypothetical protein